MWGLGDGMTDEGEIRGTESFVTRFVWGASLLHDKVGHMIQ